jgi:TetR/AcrR family transcriptional regulator, transcriptional repressor for nem operon
MGRTSDAKQRLMDTVLELIWTGSYGRTTIDLICDRAGVKKGSFYYFFASKSELTAAALESSWQKDCKPVMDAIFSASKDPLERLRDHVDHFYREQVEKARHHGHVLGCPLLSLGNEISTQDQHLRGVIQNIFDVHGRYVEAALREAAARGQINCPNPALTAHTLFLLWEGALAEARIKNDLDGVRDLWIPMQQVLGIYQNPVPQAA